MCFREEVRILDVTKCEKENDVGQQGFKETSSCNVDEYVEDPKDLVTIQPANDYTIQPANDYTIYDILRTEPATIANEYTTGRFQKRPEFIQTQLPQLNYYGPTQADKQVT